MARTRPASRPTTPWGWATAGAGVGLVLALLLFAPARWLALAVSQASAGRLVLGEPRGTLWNGSAQLVLTGGAGSKDAAPLPGRVDWHLRPGWTGLSADLEASCCMPQPLRLYAQPRWAGLRVALEDSRSQWPAAPLAGLGTPWNTLEPDGNLLLSTQNLSVEWIEGRLAVAGRAELTAQRLSSRLSTLRPMGSYLITLQGGATPDLQLSTLEGSLQLSGRGQWIGSRLRFTGEASAAPEREAALANLLNIIGRRSGPRSIITLG